MTRPTMLISANGRAVLAFPFDRWLVESLKAEIPPYARSYDPARKTWTVEQPYIRTARRLLTTVWPDAEIEEEPRFRSPSERTPRAEYHILHLQPTAPPELVEAAYKCLSRLYHPDAGGDTEKMMQINEAISTIRRRAL